MSGEAREMGGFCEPVPEGPSFPFCPAQLQPSQPQHLQAPASSPSPPPLSIPIPSGSLKHQYEWMQHPVRAAAAPARANPGHKTLSSQEFPKSVKYMKTSHPSCYPSCLVASGYWVQNSPREDDRERKGLYKPHFIRKNK